MPALRAGVDDQLGPVVVQLAENDVAAERDLLDSDIVVCQAFLTNGKMLAVLLDIDVRDVVGGADDDVADSNRLRASAWPSAEPVVEVGAELGFVAVDDRGVVANPASFSAAFGCV